MNAQTLSLPAPHESLNQAVLEYTKADGTRAQKVFTGSTSIEAVADRIKYALEVAKSKHPGHDMAETITMVPPKPLHAGVEGRDWVRCYDERGAAFACTDPNHPKLRAARMPKSDQYCVESYDADSESWDMVDEIPPCSSRSEAQEEAHHWRRGLCGNVRTRVVKF